MTRELKPLFSDTTQLRWVSTVAIISTLSVGCVALYLYTTKRNKNRILLPQSIALKVDLRDLYGFKELKTTLIEVPGWSAPLSVVLMPTHLPTCEAIFKEVGGELRAALLVGLDAEWVPQRIIKARKANAAYKNGILDNNRTGSSGRRILVETGGDSKSARRKPDALEGDGSNGGDGTGRNERLKVGDRVRYEQRHGNKSSFAEGEEDSEGEEAGGEGGRNEEKRDREEDRRDDGVTVLQLSSEDRCYIFQIGEMGGRVPPSLAALLSDPQVIKAGVGVAEDAARLVRGDPGVQVLGSLDVRVLAEALQGPAWHNAGMKTMAKGLLGMELDKQQQSSDWGVAELSMEQLTYAALDAWVSQRLVRALLAPLVGKSEKPLTEEKLRSLLQPYIGMQQTRKPKRSKKKAESGPSKLNLPATINQSAASSHLLKSGQSGGSVSKSRSQRVATRKSPLYENCRILAPDGVVLCTCGSKKIAWYLDRGLATLEQTDPLSVRLKFEPQGRGHADDKYYLSEKSNHCCVCGHAGRYVRHSVIPHCYRQYFPDSMKSHLSHDIVLLCVECKQRSNQAYHHFMVCLGSKYNAPLEGGGEDQVKRYTVDEEANAARASARALTHYSHRMPNNRVTEHKQVLLEYLRSEFVSEDDLARCCSLEVKSEITGYVSHGERVVEALTKSSPSNKCTTDQYPELESFVKEWRLYFVESMKPSHLPEHWRIENRVSNSSALMIDNNLELSGFYA